MLMMTGNLPEFIERLNETQQKYTRLSNVQINVAPLKMKHEDSVDYQRVVPLTDLIMA